MLTIGINERDSHDFPEDGQRIQQLLPKLCCNLAQRSLRSPPNQPILHHLRARSLTLLHTFCRFTRSSSQDLVLSCKGDTVELGTPFLKDWCILFILTEERAKILDDLVGGNGAWGARSC